MTGASLAAAAVQTGASAACGNDADSGRCDFQAAAAKHGANATDPDDAGIWKAATPPKGTMHGEFENNDPIGLAAGVKIPADCSLNWKDPDSGKLYCFSSATSLVYFLNAPQSYISRAKSNWKALAASKH